MKKKKTLKKSEQTKRKKFIALIVALVIIMAGAALPISLLTASAERDGMLYVRPEMTKEQLTDTIAARFGKSIADKVELLTAVRDIDPSTRIGAYKVEKGMSALSLWKALSSGAQTPIKFTFNNVRTVDEFAENASKQLALKKDDLLKLMTDSTYCQSLGFNQQTIPAMCIPDTYEVYWSITADNLLNKLNSAYKAFWTTDREKKAQKLGLTKVEVSTLASIVDSETAYKPEKATIARLYLNRLEKGMKLQSDPTAKFAVGDPTLRRITLEHIKTQSPYNTYFVEGLPPGPIRMPEKSTLDAVLNAPQNDYIYMCAKEDFSGSHNFSASYAEHQQNAARYRRALDRNGIK